MYQRYLPIHAVLMLAALLGACAATPETKPVAEVAPEQCHPEVDFAAKQYIVGYGSLMQEASRKRTAPDAGHGHPLRLTGFKRLWNARGSAVGFRPTFLGVAQDKDSELVAVVYQVRDDAEVAATDRREGLYCRVKVTPEQVTLLDGSKTPDGEMWIYFNKPDYDSPPSKRWPIVQSYVDIFLGGCLELEEKFELKEFAKQCITTTHGWSKNWVNDRIYPRRPFIHEPRAWKIDNLLHDTIPEYFEAIRIE